MLSHDLHDLGLLFFSLVACLLAVLLVVGCASSFVSFWLHAVT
jgi:hypothetical protein